MQIPNRLRHLAAALLLLPLCAGLLPAAAAQRTQAANVVGVEALSVPKGQLSGALGNWQRSVPAADGNPLYVIQATATVAPTATEFTDSISATEWSVPELVSENGAPGAVLPGSAVVWLYQGGASAPAAPSGTFTYTFADGLLSGGTLNGWSQTPPASNGFPCWAIAATALNASGTGTIAANTFSAALALSSGCAGSPTSSTVSLFQRAASMPALPGAELTYTFPAGIELWPRSVRGKMLLADDGIVYFTSSEGGTGVGTVARLFADGAVSVLYAFEDADEGYAPFAGVIQATDGNLYGTTYYGGPDRQGSVFKLTLAGELTVLHYFAKGGLAGRNPYAELVQGPDGFLYGTTRVGGQSDRGTVFRIALDGSGFTILHSFSGSDGQDPQGQLVVDTDGQLYGTTMMGGADNRGVIFRISTTGDYQRLYSFPKLDAFNGIGLATNADGANPRAGLLRTAAGTFVGTTNRGGEGGNGTLFRAVISGDAADVSVVHAFEGWAFDGGFPLGAVVQGPDGDFYGTSERGGYGDSGAVWKVAQDGSSFTMLHGFLGSATDGRTPYASPLFAHGFLYAVATSDNAGGAGAISRMEMGTSGVLPVDFTASDDPEIEVGESITLAWNAPGALSCDKFSSWNEPTSEDDPNHITPISGSATLSPGAGVFSYGLSCTFASGEIYNALVGVTVSPPRQQPVDGGAIVGGGEWSWLLLALLAALLFVKLFKEKRFSCP